MKDSHFLRLLPIIVKDFLWFNFLLTAVGGYFYSRYGNYFIPGFFWLKTIGFAIAWFTSIQREGRLYFYYNLGFTKVRLVLLVLILDWLVAITTLMIIHAIIRS